jgi:hypothetical protein
MRIKVIERRDRPHRPDPIRRLRASTLAASTYLVKVEQIRPAALSTEAESIREV